MNPYKAAAGSDLDTHLGQAYYGENGNVLVKPFSTEVKAANILKARIEALYRHDVVVGQTRTRTVLYFARLETDPSTSVEATAETYALAVARLGLVLANRQTR